MVVSPYMFLKQLVAIVSKIRRGGFNWLIKNSSSSAKSLYLAKFHYIHWSYSFLILVQVLILSFRHDILRKWNVAVSLVKVVYFQDDWGPKMTGIFTKIQYDWYPYKRGQLASETDI